MCSEVTLLLSGMLANVPGFLGKGALTYSCRQFLQCKYSHCSLFQARDGKTLKSELEETRSTDSDKRVLAGCSTTARGLPVGLADSHPSLNSGLPSPLPRPCPRPSQRLSKPTAALQLSCLASITKCDDTFIRVILLLLPPF